MKKAMAYEILRLEANAPLDEIKKAYAALSKQYHPEENPEEFQRIHEAYITLVRHNKQNNRNIVESTSIDWQQEEIHRVIHNVIEVEDKVSEVSSEKEEKLYNFDEVEYKV